MVLARQGGGESESLEQVAVSPLEYLGGTVDDIYLAERGLWSGWALG